MPGTSFSKPGSDNFITQQPSFKLTKSYYMDLKEQYLKAMRINNGILDEIEIGYSLGLDESSTRKIISRLLSEFKIEFVSNGHCNYRIMKSQKV